jgi:hypothetical protein
MCAAAAMSTGMVRYGVAAGVSKIARLHQVTVIVLAANGGEPSLNVSLSDVVTSTANIVVIDCLDVHDIVAEDRNRIVAAHFALKAEQRHLIVVNAPVSVVPLLKEQGVDVAATDDIVFDDYRHAKTGCS